MLSIIHSSFSIIGDDYVVSKLFHSAEASGIPPEFSGFLNRCFITRVRCLLDSTSGFLVRSFDTSGFSKCCITDETIRGPNVLEQAPGSSRTFFSL